MINHYKNSKNELIINIMQENNLFKTSKKNIFSVIYEKNPINSPKNYIKLDHSVKVEIDSSKITFNPFLIKRGLEIFDIKAKDELKEEVFDGIDEQIDNVLFCLIKLIVFFIIKLIFN